MTAAGGAEALSETQARDLLEWLRTHGPDNTVGAGYQARIYRYRGPAGEFVIKEALGSWLRKRVSEAAVRREEQIYARLAGVPGVPRCYGLLEGRFLVLQFVPGDSFRRLEHQLEDGERFFSKLLRTLQGMHRAGVAHGDLKRKDNILVGPDEEPFVIDFGVAVVSESGRGFVFETLKQADINAWIKHKYRGQIKDLREEDAAIYRPMLLERVARAIRIVWQKLTFRRWRKRNRVRA